MDGCGGGGGGGAVIVDDFRVLHTSGDGRAVATAATALGGDGGGDDGGDGGGDDGGNACGEGAWYSLYT